MDRPHAVLSARDRLPRRHFLRTARLDAATTRAVADQLSARGLPVRVEEHRPGSPALRYAHRHARQVHAALEDLGISAPFP